MPRRCRGTHRELRDVPYPPAAVSPDVPAADAARHLEDLRTALHRAAPELFVRLVRPHMRPPYLHVNNPVGAGRFSEDITVQPGDVPGESHYSWSWGETITPTSTPEFAAQAVLKVLAEHGKRK
jgi:hypothetical protein